MTDIRPNTKETDTIPYINTSPTLNQGNILYKIVTVEGEVTPVLIVLNFVKNDNKHPNPFSVHSITNSLPPLKEEPTRFQHLSDILYLGTTTEDEFYYIETDIRISIYDTLGKIAKMIETAKRYAQIIGLLPKNIFKENQNEITILDQSSNLLITIEIERIKTESGISKISIQKISSLNLEFADLAMRKAMYKI